MAVDIFLAGLFGLLIGSFLNVCIYRLPRDLSVVQPRSHCPACQAMVQAFDNIPLLSYLILRGRCRRCGSPIPIRYPLVEALTAAAFALFAAQSGITLLTARNCVFAALMIALAFTDLETRILPEPLTLGAIACGVGFAFAVPMRDGTAALFGLTGRMASIADALLGALVPSFALWFAGFLFQKLRKREGLGFGDLVLLCAIGTFLGLRATLLTLILASVAGSLIGGVYILLSGKQASTYELPLGSFLAATAIFVLAFGQGIIRWYSSLIY